MQKVASKKNGFIGSATHDFSKGKIPEDWWSDIPLTQRYRHEVAHFETQKPKKLLERVIKATTKEGDLVGDFFAGSGTTVVVAEELKRRWITCDATVLSTKITRKRLGADLQRPYLVEKMLKNEVHPKPQTRVLHLSKKKTSEQSITIALTGMSSQKKNSLSPRSRTRSISLIDSWAIDWHYTGDVFRAVWDTFRGNEKEGSQLMTRKEYKFRKNIPTKIAVKAVDIFGNETLRLITR